MSKIELDEIVSFVSKVPLFQGLTIDEYSTLCNAMIPRTLGDNNTIVYEDDVENQNFYLLLSGKVNVTVSTQEGKQAILATFQKGDFFGEMSILDGEPRSASVITIGECELLVLYRKTLLEILQNHPQIAIRMLVAMSKRLRRTNRQINTLSMMSVYGRIADVILQISHEQGIRYNDGMIVVTNPPTQQEIAEMAGTSRETVSRILSQLRKKRYILNSRKKMVILNEKKLYD